MVRTVLFLAGLLGPGRSAMGASPSCDYIFTQAPARQQALGEGARIVRLTAGIPRVLTAGFHSAADPEISFDGTRILFAAKRDPAGPWNIFEMSAEGSNVRQITHSPTDCRSPIYQSSIFYLDDAAPVPQIAYVSTEPGESVPSIYSIRLDGSGLRRLTYSPAGAFGPAMLPDGRMVFTSGRPGRMVLFGINIDGTDYAAFAGEQGTGLQTMPAVTPKRQVVFVEPRPSAPRGAGSLSLIDLRRNLHSYRRLGTPTGGLYHSPSPLPDGAVLASRRAAGPPATFGIYRIDPATLKQTRIFDDPATDDLQPKALAPRDVPDGRSSVVDESVNWAKLYCLNVYDSDLAPRDWPRGSVKRVRIIESVPASPGAAPLTSPARLIGEVPVDDDGSFNVQIPAGIPLRVQALAADGMALRTSAWIWVKNKEQRGCIGCHEDGERTPENVMATALTRPSANLILPAERRRVVNYQRDIAPIIRAKCINAACHVTKSPVAQPYITPGAARTSPLVWSIFGKNTSRPWDKPVPSAIRRMPPAGVPQLTEAEKRAIVEWIDLGGAR